MNLNQLHYFVTLAHMEHFTKAAEELDITQPSLSHAMTTLEQELGTKLFQKQGRGVSLTKYGQIFLKYAEESLRILDMGVRKTKEMTGQTGGVIDLAYIYTLGSEFVPRLVGDFLRAHEELSIRFHFTVGNTSEILAGLKDEKYDVAFCSMLKKSPRLNLPLLPPNAWYWWFPKAIPCLSRKTAFLWRRQLLIPRSFFTKSSGLRPVIDHLFEQAKIRPRIAYEIEEDSSMAGLIAQNFGIGIMPDIPVLRTLNVDILPLNLPKHRRYVYMALCRNHYHPPVVDKFIKYVENSISL